MININKCKITLSRKRPNILIQNLDILIPIVVRLLK